MALAFMDQQRKEIHRRHSRKSKSTIFRYIVKLISSIGSYSGPSHQAYSSLSGNSTCLSQVMASSLSSPIAQVDFPLRYENKLERYLMIVFSWLPVIDETVVLACQIFNLERSYRINGSRILVLIIITPFMSVSLSGHRT